MNNHINTNHLSKHLNCERRMIMKKYALKITTLLAALTLCLSCVTPTCAYQTIRNGSRSEDARVLQHYLNTVTGAGLQEDGIVGQKTIHALKMYQAANNLSVDGICGRMTWASLEGAYNNALVGTVVMPQEGLYTIRSARDDNYAIDVAGAGNNLGTPVQIYHYNGTAAQILNLRKVDGEFYEIVDAANNLCLNVNGGNCNYDGRIHLWSSDYNCQFRFINAGNGSVFIEPRGNTYFCFDAHDADKDGCYDTQILHLWEHHDGSSCRWYLREYQKGVTTRALADVSGVGQIQNMCTSCAMTDLLRRAQVVDGNAPTFSFGDVRTNIETIP